MNPAVWVERHGRRRPDDPALADGERVHATWGAFAARTAGAAAGLRDDLGLSPGDRVAIVMRNRPEYLEALFAIWHAGLVAVPVNARLHRDEIAYILEHSESAVVVTDADHAGDVESLVGTVASLQAAVVAPGERWDRLTASSPAPLVGRQPEDPAWLFYTSGTTGRPKGATLTNRNLLMMTLSYFADIDAVVPQDCILHAAPLSHGSGLYGLPHVARGAVSVVPQSGGVDGDEIAALLRHWPGMSFFAAPTMVKRLAGDRAVAAGDLSHLKTIIYGGAPMYLADLEDALAVFGPRLAQIYGQGETPMTITALSKADHADRSHPRWRDRLQSVGVARTDVEVRVVDDDRELPAGEVGEVVVRGDVVMAGYWNQPDATAEALRGGWLHTGDVGSFDADGYLTLRDRSKDLIISGGMNIYPREVEEALLRHSGVRAAAVVGRPDAEWGEAVVAFVVAADGAAPPPVEDLDRTCLDHIARFKRPKDYRFVDALPTNNYGKVVKRELRDRLRAEADTGEAPLRRPATIGRGRLLEGARKRAARARSVGRRHPCTHGEEASLMKLALYLPNFRDKVTVKELEDLTGLAEELDFDSVWTLDRIVVPEASDRVELQYSFGMMNEFPKALPVSSRGRVAPRLAADPLARREDDEGADRHEHHRHAIPRARRPRGGDRHRRPALERQGQRGRRVRLDARGVRGRERLAHLPQAAQARARDDRDHAGHLDERPLRVPRRVRRLRADAGSERSLYRSRTRRSSSAGSRTRSARRTASRSTACRAGSGSRTRRTSSSNGAAPSSESSRSSGAPARSTISRSAA